jgi:hypothetical protein
VLAEGLRGRTTPSRTWLAPLPHQVYLGRSFPSALSYAFDGLYAYNDVEARWDEQNPRRTVGVVLRAEAPIEACLPDEDWVGKMMAAARDGTLYSNAAPRLWDQSPLPTALQDRFAALWNALPPAKTQGWRDERRTTQDTVAAYARIGKATIRNQIQTEAGRARLQGLLPWAPSVAAAEGSVTLNLAWIVRAENVPRMAPDGLNLNATGELVSMPPRARPEKWKK